MAGRFFFTLTYWTGIPPWDTGITPPEVYHFLEGKTPGKALDLGCGTGTNVITIAEHGWQADGIDFVTRAIKKAGRKARKLGLQDQTSFLTGDILKPGLILGKYDLILDIGCFHSFSGEDVDRYIENVLPHLASGGTYLLYVHLNDDPSGGHGIHESNLNKLGEKLRLIKRTDGDESQRPSAWLEFRRE